MTRRAHWAIVAAIALSGALLATGPAAHAAPSCAGSEVTVVVDFRGLGGHDVQTGCALNPSSGFDALRKAGFQIVQVANDPGFLCRIDGLPDASHEGCAHDPPSGAYWSYWHSGPGGTWTYADEGGGTFKPPAGTIDGWSFPNGAVCSLPPRYGSGPTTCPSSSTTTPTTQPASPPATHAPDPTVTTTRSGGATTTTAPSGGAAAPPAGSGGDGGGGSATATGGTASAVGSGSAGSIGATGPSGAGSGSSTTGTTPGATGSTATSGGPTTGGRGVPKAGATSSTTPAGSGAGSATGVLAGTGAIAAIGAGAAVTVQRRRRATDGRLELPLDPPPGPPS